MINENNMLDEDSSDFENYDDIEEDHGLNPEYYDLIGEWRGFILPWNI